MSTINDSNFRKTISENGIITDLW